ncbi:DUF433 domain-containing protein [Chloroflexota bacterium]
MTSLVALLVVGMWWLSVAGTAPVVLRDLGDAFPAIESEPSICGGEPCIVRTRIPVWLLAQARHLGASEADLLHAYPTLRAQDLTNAWSFYRAHNVEIEQQIRENEDA